MFCDGVNITWLAGCLGPSRLVRREGLALRDLEADWERRRILPSAWDLQSLMNRGKRIDLWSAWLQRMLALQNGVCYANLITRVQEHEVPATAGDSLPTV